MGCWNSSKAKNQKNGAAGIPARLKNQKDGLLEFQQGQKIKKMGCWNSSKAENEKNGAAGAPARAKNQKDGLLELQQAKKSKRRAAGTPASQKMRQTLARLPYDSVK